MTTAETYVTAAYCVVFALVLAYVVIIALKVQRLERDVARLEDEVEAAEQDEREPARVG
ncbi:MAG TPA: CcmD family protein [Gaiellaceae bacterium]|nr:CcmD family protein [Gaiellaceae bacterium]